MAPDELHRLAQQRILDEWRANIDLHKFHDAIKHQRITHFLTAEAALVALAGLLLKESIGARSGVWAVVLLPATVGFVLARIYRNMDARARAYVDVVKARLLILEAQWNEQMPTSKLSTYTDQWQLLVCGVSSSEGADKLAEYEAARRLGDRDILRKQLEARGAYLGEKRLFTLVSWLWILLVAAGIILTLIIQ